MATSHWRDKRRQVFHSVFQTDISQPTPYSTPCLPFPDQGQPFGGPVPGSTLYPPPGTPGLSTTRVPGRIAEHGSGVPDASPPGRKSLSSTHALDGTSSLSSPSSPLFYPQARGGADDQVQFDRAWHVVTSRIALPSSVAAEDSFGTLAPESQLQSQDASTEADFQLALQLVLNARSALPRAVHTEDILDWHTQQVRRHYVQHVLPMLAACADGPAIVAGSDEEETRGYEQQMVVVRSSIRTLEAALRLYYYGLSLIMRGLPRGEDGSLKTDASGLVAARFRRDVHALVGNSASSGLMLAIRAVLERLVGAILGLRIPGQSDKKRVAPGQYPKKGVARPEPPGDDSVPAIAERQRLHDVVEALSKVGLAGERFQVLFAEVMDTMMSNFVKYSYARLWTAAEHRDGLAKKSKSRSAAAAGPSPCIASLNDWTENHYSRLALEVLGRISGGEEAVSLADVRRWKDIGLGRLASLRISELFDIVLSWPSSKGGLDDLCASITTPQRRAQLVASFSGALQKRLLHPARSTLEILQVYIAMIRTFHALDGSNVLLGGAVGPLQLYLCQREDAVRIVVTGLLANPEEVEAATKAKEESVRGGTTLATKAAAPAAGKLVELAMLLNDPAQQRRQYVDEGELDWHDMDWVPDPVDAGVNYKRPRSEDVIGTIIGALGSQDVFIKEFQMIIAERLLSTQSDFAQEGKVLNLLKKRFGDAALQNCDVMIKDIADSHRVDSAIRRAQTQLRGPAMPATPAGASAQGHDAGSDGAATEPELSYHARILSRLFWPALSKDTFLLPNPVADLQRRYEAGYEHLKASRKLAWLDHLGQAAVELELADRTLTVECKTYEAAVVYAFQDPDGREGQDATAEVRRSVDELMQMLHMDDDLVRLALGFWVSRGVLAPVGGDVFAVIETQSEGGPHAPSSTGAASSAAQAAGGPDTPRGVGGGAAGQKALDAKEKMQRTVYWQFIVGMLTNSASSMPLGQIAMMMKMLIAEGFPWSNEELQEFLAEKVADGELEVVGGKYRLAKK